MAAMPKILIIDDDVELCQLLQEFFAPEGFDVQVKHDGESGLQAAIKNGYALTVLDLMLPKLNGLEVLKRLRAVSSLPVLLLTARGEEVDRIVGLEIGADDYLSKPFSPRELLARIRAILRRTTGEARSYGLAHESSGGPETAAHKIVVGEVELDPGSRTVRRNRQALDLTSVEFNVLEALLRNAGRVVSREQLAKSVLGRIFSPFDRSIDMHVSKLRKKLGPSPAGDEYIKTVRGAGYLYSFPGAAKP